MRSIFIRVYVCMNALYLETSCTFIYVYVRIYIKYYKVFIDILIFNLGKLNE